MGSIKHAKTSPVPNPLGDTRRVGGGDWNSEHIIDLEVADIDGLEARLIPVEQVEQFRDDALAFRNEAAGSASDAAASAAEAAATVGALAAPGGAELVGTPEGTVQEALDGRVKQDELSTPATVPAYAFSAAEAQSIFDNALPMADYAELRAYDERAVSVKIAVAGIPLIFERSTTDTTSPDDDGSIIVDALGRRWIAQQGGVLYVEQFGASASATPAANAAAIAKALMALQSGWLLRQKTDLLGVDLIVATKTIDQVGIKLNLRYDGATEGASVVYLTNFTRSILDISIDCNDKSTYGLRAQNCTGSVAPTTALIKNIFATAFQAAGILTRDSDDMQLLATIQNVRSDGSQVVRGIMISDQTIAKNTSLVAPRINGVFTPSGGALDDADGVYAEHSNPGHLGGLKFIGGDYQNCSKRNIKCTMANPTITGNTGNNALATAMYSFVSVYDNDAGYVGENSFSYTGAAGVVYGLEYGAAASAQLTMRVGRNSLKSSVSAVSSAGIRVIGKIISAQIDPGVVSGFKQLMSQNSATAETGQSLIMRGGRFDGLGVAANNCIGTQGGYARLNVSGVQAVDAVAGAYFVANSQLADGVAEIIDNVQAYSFGMCQKRPLNGWDLSVVPNNSLPRYENGVAIYRRASSPPTGGANLVGDRVEYTAPVAGGFSGAVCTVAGTPGTWKTKDPISV